MYKIFLFELLFKNIGIIQEISILIDLAGCMNHARFWAFSGIFKKTEKGLRRFSPKATELKTLTSGPGVADVALTGIEELLDSLHRRGR